MKLYILFGFFLFSTFSIELVDVTTIIENSNLVNHYNLALEAIFGIGVRLQALLDEKKNENFLVSPISVAVVIGQLMLGAEGRFRDRLFDLLSLPNTNGVHKNDRINSYGRKNESYALPYSTLHLQLSSLVKVLEGHLGQFLLKHRSALFYDRNLILKEEFARNMEYIYLTKLYGMNFKQNPQQALQFINEWCSKNTQGLIKTILYNTPSPSTSAIFVNALYFLAEWETPFSDELNREGPFYVDQTKQINVIYMFGFLEQIFYSESETYHMIALPYKNDDVKLYIILPRMEAGYNINEFAKTMKSTEILNTIEKGKKRDVTIKMPKMQLSYRFSILQQLKKYNAYRDRGAESRIYFEKSENVLVNLDDKIQAFENFTDNNNNIDDVYLSNAAIGQNFKISDIIQQVILNVNEKGTEAAAVTATTIDYSGGSKNFIITKPFIFFIRHEASFATLFWGAVSNPNGSS